MAFYMALEQKKAGIQVAFASMFTLIALIVLLSAIWFGLNFANGSWPRSAADPRHRPGGDRQFYVQVPVRRGRGRSRPSGRDLQQDDLGTAPPARRAHRRQ